MNAAKKALARTTNFVADHKVAIAVTTTAAVTTVFWVNAMRKSQADVNEFLEEHGLLEKFFATSDLEI